VTSFRFNFFWRTDFSWTNSYYIWITSLNFFRKIITVANKILQLHKSIISVHASHYKYYITIILLLLSLNYSLYYIYISDLVSIFIKFSRNISCDFISLLFKNFEISKLKLIISLKSMVNKQLISN